MKNGFTLVELLAVIVILAIIGVLVSPLVLGVINKSEEDVTKSQKTIIERAARHYVESNIYTLPDSCDTSAGCTITIGELKKDGYLEIKDIKNASTDEDISDSATVKISRTNGKYSFAFQG